jgi:F0F1-type ATP synthase assembly protein I
MDKKAIREIAVASAMYSLGSILGPLLIFGGIGLFLDKIFSTHPWILLGSVLVAFVVTNILLFKKIKKINQMMDKYRQELINHKKKESR